ncbi:Ribosomal protein L37a [Giardia muris]|uniref:Ribosomal protein L37a n=1 Tax=Giardia muris TaxID=5742 RepID=A0A4Z1STM4_GIAMU|nr:Ribosomal protein L37a [Giardia muris]|eukprot:TNJ29282.1 Ribosomal protein L37a [Giardia muris]
MARRTKKVGLTGKYGTRYGRAARKQLLKIERNQKAKYTCPFCAKDKVRRSACGIWKCRACEKTIAGGAYTLHTEPANTARATIRRLRDIKKDA